MVAMHRVWQAQAAVAVCAASLAAVLWPSAMVAILAASVAVILSEVMYAVACWRILRSRESGRVGRAIRARYLKVATMVAFLTVSLGAVGQGVAEVVAWSLTVVALVLVPALVAQAALARGRVGRQGD